METLIHGSSLNSPAFQKALHSVLRTLIDKLNVTTFNVGILGMNAVSGDLAADFVKDRSKASPTADSEPVSGITAR